MDAHNVPLITTHTPGVVHYLETKKGEQTRAELLMKVFDLVWRK